jgi:hypothetical protein
MEDQRPELPGWKCESGSPLFAHDRLAKARPQPLDDSLHCRLRPFQQYIQVLPVQRAPFVR